MRFYFQISFFFKLPVDADDTPKNLSLPLECSRMRNLEVVEQFIQSRSAGGLHRGQVFRKVESGTMSLK